MLREIILTRKMRKQATFATFIDARKAYDTVWREGNEVRLFNMGVRGKLWRQLQAMSKDPQSKIRLPFGETQWFKITRGVAQGAVESPFLYSCFINALAGELKDKGLGIQIAGVITPLLLYADDIVLLANSIAELRAMNEVVTNFAYRNRYTLNGDKSAIMVFNASPEVVSEVEQEPWTLSGEPVEVKTQYKYLGVNLLCNVADWTVYVNRIIAKATRVSQDLAWICRRDAGLRPRSAVTLWKAIVRPILEYAAELWAGEIPKTLADRAEAVQTSFAKVILGLVGCQSIPHDLLRAELGMERLESRWEKLRLGYWRRIHVANPDRTFSGLAKLRIKHFNWGRAHSGWMKGTNELLTARGMASHWADPSLCTERCKGDWKDEVYEAVEAAQQRDVHQRLAGMIGESASRYSRIKQWGRIEPEFARFSGEIGRRGALVSEPYLDGREEPIGCKLKLMCRMGCLPTLHRVAREQSWPAHLAVCMMCNSGEIENMQHMINDCAAYATHRSKMLGGIRTAASRATGVDEAQGHWGPHIDIDLLLGKSTGSNRIDSIVDKSVQRFMKKAWRTRSGLTEALNTVLDRQDTIWALKVHGDNDIWPRKGETLCK